MRGKGEWKSRSAQLSGSVVTKNREKAAERHKRVIGNSRNMARKGQGKKANGVGGASVGGQVKQGKQSVGGVVAVWQESRRKRKEQRGLEKVGKKTRKGM